MIVALPGETIPPGESGYCATPDFPQRGLARRWRYRAAIRSGQWPGRSGGIVKISDAFEDHPPGGPLEGLLDEARSNGIEKPSGYADLFHKRWHAPPIRRAYQKMFRGAVRGGWVELLASPASVRNRAVWVDGPVWHYDLRSAYLSAVADGLPDPRTFRVVERYSGPGVYWCQSPAVPHWPYPWNRPGVFAASWEEIEGMHGTSAVIGKGVAFQPGTYADGYRIVAEVQRWSCWKQVARSFWGRWAAAGGPTCETLTPDGDIRTSRELPPLFSCPTWAAIITSRVRNRMRQVYDTPAKTGRLLLVLTDAVVVTFPLETGDNIGDWREVAHFPRGAHVSLTGAVGE